MSTNKTTGLYESAAIIKTEKQKKTKSKPKRKGVKNNEKVQCHRSEKRNRPEADA